MQKMGDCVLTPKGVEQCVGSDGGGGYVKAGREGGSCSSVSSSSRREEDLG